MEQKLNEFFFAGNDGNHGRQLSKKMYKINTRTYEDNK